MVSSVTGEIPTIAVAGLVNEPTMAYVWMIDRCILSAYVSVWVDFTDEWLDPFWDRLKGQCYTLALDKFVEDKNMMHCRARFIQYHIHQQCPGRKCEGTHGG